MDPYAGSLYYDNNTGQIMQYNGNTTGYSGGGGGGGGGGSWGSTFSEPTSSGNTGFPTYSPAVLGDSTSTPTYSTFSSGGTQQVVTDPYAQWGGKASYDSLVNGFNADKNMAYSSFGDATAQSATGIRNSILDYIDSLRSAQRQIDQTGINADLAKRQGSEDILNMVNRGINSGGVMLQNKNASDSSAADAIARAYAQIGGQEMRGVGNQYAQKQAEIGLQQEDLNNAGAKFSRDFEQKKIETVNTLVADVMDKLGAIDARMADASLPDRIALEQEKTRLKNEALASLSQYDQQLATDRESVKPLTAEERAIKAAELQRAGTDLGANTFNYSTAVPAQFQGTGPFSSDLPIFTSRTKKQG